MSVAPTYFADTSFWIALLEAGDQHHARALAWQNKIVRDRTFLITTEPVLWETLNYFAIPAARVRAVRLYHACHNRQEIGVVDFDAGHCQAAVALYETRRDKEWGIIDCFSFEVMRETKMTDALTADRHFGQAGFGVLLLRDPLP
jgi:predicted nucleic acid-binding protein